MNQLDAMAAYFAKIMELRVQLMAIDVKIENEELVPFVLGGFTSTWESFIQGNVCATLLTFEELWKIFPKEETKRESVLVKR